MHNILSTFCIIQCVKHFSLSSPFFLALSISYTSHQRFSFFRLIPSFAFSCKRKYILTPFSWLSWHYWLQRKKVRSTVTRQSQSVRDGVVVAHFTEDLKPLLHVHHHHHPYQEHQCPCISCHWQNRRPSLCSHNSTRRMWKERTVKWSQSVNLF